MTKLLTLPTSMKAIKEIKEFLCSPPLLGGLIERLFPPTPMRGVDFLLQSYNETPISFKEIATQKRMPSANRKMEHLCSVREIKQAIRSYFDEIRDDAKYHFPAKNIDLSGIPIDEHEEAIESILTANRKWSNRIRDISEIEKTVMNEKQLNPKLFRAVCEHQRRLRNSRC